MAKVRSPRYMRRGLELYICIVQSLALYSDFMFNEKRVRDIFKGIKRRCSDKKNKFYYARGIKCEWENYQQFKADMLKTYISHIEIYGEKDTTIDRINNDSNYSVSNCKWATWKEQFNNRRTTHKITYAGETKSISEWARAFGCSREMLKDRLEMGWSFERAMSVSFNRPVHEYTAKAFALIAPDGSTVEGSNLRKFCRDNKLSPSAMSNVKAGRSLQHKGWKFI